jgi:O-antigen/teichoic acid export membrane protein
MARDINYTKRTLYNTITVFAFLIIAAFCAYLFRIILARNLTLAEYGLFFALVAFAGILNIFRDLGLSYATTYFVPRYLAKKDFRKIKSLISRIFRIEIISTAIVAILFIVLSDFLVTNYFHSGTMLILSLFAVSFFLNAMELNFQLFFNAFQRQFLYSLHNMLRNLLVLIFAAIAFMFFKGVIVPIAAYMITYIILLILFSIIFFRKVFPDYFSTKKSYISTKSLFAFGFSASLSSIGFLLISSMDTLLLTYFRTLEEVGLYNGVLPIVSIILYIPYAISSVITPMSSELFAKKRMDTLRMVAEKMTRFTLVALIPLVGLTITYPEFILAWFFGSAFAAAAGALVILSIGIIFYALSQISMSIIFASIGPKKNILIYLYGAVANLILNILLVPKYGIIGAAIATSISYFIIFCLSQYYLSRVLSWRPSIGKYALSILLGVVFIALVSYLKTLFIMPVLLQIILTIGIAGAVYICMLFLFRIVTIDEIKELKSKIF